MGGIVRRMAIAIGASVLVGLCAYFVFGIDVARILAPLTLGFVFYSTRPNKQKK